MPLDDMDEELRGAMFAYLRNIADRRGGLVTWSDLQAFTFHDERVSLIGQRGIRKVAGLEAALTIFTTHAPRPDMRPYADDDGPEGYPRYKWRGSDPQHYDNVALRRAMELGKPLAWFLGVGTGLYEAHCPVWLVAEEPEQQQFVLALEEGMREQWTSMIFHPADLAARRRYVEDVVRRRLHQRMFRDRVLLAYRTQCALCRLRHEELLDAAHIRADAEGGEPIVPNGIAMCAIHHRAFDSHFLAVRPDYVIELRKDVLEEQDGPTLRHALQGLHRQPIVLPRQRAARPDREALEARYDLFRAAS